jgi:hypothetical protein
VPVCCHLLSLFKWPFINWGNIHVKMAVSVKHEEGLNQTSGLASEVNCHLYKHFTIHRIRAIAQTIHRISIFQKIIFRNEPTS